MRSFGFHFGVCILALAQATASGCSIPAKGEANMPKAEALSAEKVLEDMHPTPIPMPRDPQVAVNEEFEAAKQANTKAAWELFLRRHPDSTLAGAARRELHKLGLNTKDE